MVSPEIITEHLKLMMSTLDAKYFPTVQFHAGRPIKGEEIRIEWVLIASYLVGNTWKGEVGIGPSFTEAFAALQEKINGLGECPTCGHMVKSA